MSKPLLAIVANVVTPYRVHLHQRVVAEIPEVELVSFFTHSQADFNWEDQPIGDINPVFLGGASVRVSDAGRLSNWPREWRLGKEILSRLASNPKSMVISNGYNDFTRLRLIRSCSKLGIPIFLRADSNVLGDSKNAAKQFAKTRYLRYLMPKMSGYMPMGELGVRYFVKYGADANRCFLVPYEPDYSFFASSDPVATAEFQKKFNLSPDRKRFLFCGRLVPVKRVDLLFQAFERVSDEFADWDLVVVGDGVLRQALEEQIGSRLKHRVHWLGFLDRDQTKLAYHACDVLVLPSDYEPWAVVITEALAAGLPVIASHVCGAAHELLSDGLAGCCFEKGDLSDLVDKIKKVGSGQNLAEFQARTGPTLKKWHEKSDPIKGIRAALFASGILN